MYDYDKDKVRTYNNSRTKKKNWLSFLPLFNLEKCNRLIFLYETAETVIKMKTIHQMPRCVCVTCLHTHTHNSRHIR